MRLLLDSHYCLWLTLRRDRLRKTEFAVIDNPDNDLAFSSVSLWELRIKWDKRYISGERKLDASPTDILDGLRAVAISAVDLSPELATTPLHTPIAHEDPFDSLLLTIAQETGRKLMTRDAKLRGHPMAYHVD